MTKLATSLLGLFLVLGGLVWTGIQRAETHESNNQLRAIPVGQTNKAGNPNSLAQAAATRGVLTPQEGHSGSVESVAFSSNGRLIVSGGEDSTVRLWDAASGTLIRVFRGHSGPVNSVAFSPDGRLIVSGSSDQTLRLWEAASGALVVEVKATASVTSVGYSRDGRHILAASTDGILLVRNTGSGETRKFQSEGGKTVFARFSPDGRRIAARAGAGKRLLLWDVASGALTREINVDASWHGLAFSPDGRRILAGSGADLQLFDAARGAPIRRFTLAGQSEVRIVVGEDRGWTVSSVEFSPDGQRIMFGGGIFDAATGQRIHTFGDYLIDRFMVGEIAFAPAAFSPDGRGIVTGLWSELRLWDVATGASTRKFEGFHYEPSQHSRLAHFAAFAADGHNIVSAGLAPARVWDSGSGSLVREFDREPLALGTFALSADGTRVVSSPSPFPSYALHLWDVASGKMIQKITGRMAIQSSAFSPDGRRILVSTSYGETLQLIDATTGAPIVEAHLVSSAGSSSIAFSPDGRRILLGRKMMNTASLDRSAVQQSPISPLFLEDREFQVLAVAEGPITAAAFSPDGKRVLTGGADHTLRLWEATSLALDREFRGHSDAITSLAFSPDGQRILSGSKDGTVRVWEAASGALVHTFKDHEVTSVAFSPDGQRILSAGIDNTWRLWDAASFAPIMTMRALPELNWMVELPDGRYRSTDGASRWLAVIDGVTILPMEPHEKAFRMPARDPNAAQ